MPGSGVHHGGDDDDMNNAAEEASRQAGDSGDTDLFSSVLGAITQNKQQIANQDLDEEGEWPRSITPRMGTVVAWTQD